MSAVVRSVTGTPLASVALRKTVRVDAPGCWATSGAAPAADSATAMAAALTYRLVTFYAPPLLGYFAMRSLREQRLL